MGILFCLLLSYYALAPAETQVVPVHHLNLLLSSESIAKVPGVGLSGSGPGAIATPPLTPVGENDAGVLPLTDEEIPKAVSSDKSVPSTAFTRDICVISAEPNQRT